MRTVIYYMTKHGTTEKVAEILRQYLASHHVDIVNLKHTKTISPNRYDTIIIGGSIHLGRIQKGIRRFISRYHSTLSNKNLGLYICCMEKGSKRQEEFDEAYPEDLRKTAIAKGVLGGEYLLDRMNFIEKFIIQKISGQTQNISEIDREAIRKFADRISAQSTL